MGFCEGLRGNVAEGLLLGVTLNEIVGMFVGECDGKVVCGDRLGIELGTKLGKIVVGKCEGDDVVGGKVIVEGKFEGIEKVGAKDGFDVGEKLG